MPLDATTLLAFLAAATVLVLIPGPGTAWVLGQSVAGGARRGIVAGLGLETATQLHALAASLGLSALLAASATAYETLRYAGAAYLIWLGIRTWRQNAGGESSGPDTGGADANGSMRRVYLRSVLTGVLNPKVALFFLAFLPQFVHPEQGMVWLQFLVLGALLSVVGFAHSCLLALASSRIGGAARSARMVAWRQRAVGTLFVGLGLRLALQSRH
jgi:threonine/homoserine/homoserine lactone efflux protein